MVSAALVSSPVLSASVFASSVFGAWSAGAAVVSGALVALAELVHPASPAAMTHAIPTATARFTVLLIILTFSFQNTFFYLVASLFLL